MGEAYRDIIAYFLQIVLMTRLAFDFKDKRDAALSTVSRLQKNANGLTAILAVVTVIAWTTTAITTVTVRTA